MSEEKTEEKREPRWSELNLATLRSSAAEVCSFSPSAKRLRIAYAEVLAHLEEASKGKLEFECGRCRSPVDGEMRNCWACGSTLSGEGEEKIVLPELRKRAKRLGIESEGKDYAALTREIELAEAKRRASNKDSDLGDIEARRLNEQLAEILPDGWSLNRTQRYTAYRDSKKVRRFGVFNRGLIVHFSVDDGFFAAGESVEFFDSQERARRHFGRTNYSYSGELSKEVIKLCRKVFAKYG